MKNTVEKSHDIYDVIGIGIGPFNLGLAALLDPITEIKSLFLEKKSEFNWHPGMLIDGTTLQVPFLADLVSMVNVKSEYSFLRYLQKHNRLYHYYFLEKFHISRKEYNDYCRWVSNQLEQCLYGMTVESVTYKQTFDGEGLYEVTAWNEKTKRMDCYFTKNIVIGTGTVPFVPAHLEHALGETVFHSSDYLKNKPICEGSNSIAVIGSGQSAAEIFYDLAKEQESNDYSLSWYTRSKGFFPMEYSKLGLEYFSPDYIDFFYNLPQHKKDSLIQEQDLLYKGISSETIADIYDHLYERTIGNHLLEISLQPMTEIVGMELLEEYWSLQAYHRVKEKGFEIKADIVILGTGYKPSVPAFLSEMADLIIWDEQGRYKIKRDYRLETKVATSNEIYIQNGELHTHGVGAPDLGLGAYRNATIINHLAKKEIYPVKTKNVFQRFGTNEIRIPAEV